MLRAASATHAFEVREQEWVRSHAVSRFLGRKTVDHLSEGALVNHFSYYPRVGNHLRPRRLNINVRPMGLFSEEVSACLELKLGHSSAKPGMRICVRPRSVPSIEVDLKVKVSQLAIRSARRRHHDDEWPVLANILFGVPLVFIRVEIDTAHQIEVLAH